MKQIAWDEVDKLERNSRVRVSIVERTFEYLDNKWQYINLAVDCNDDDERKIIDEATAQIRAHREKKFKDALARYVAEQGDNT